MQKLGEWLKCRSVVLAGLVMATACAEQEPADEAGPEPLAELALDNGGIVQFFEVKPGAILIRQYAPQGVPDVTGAGLSALALYQRLAPSGDAPVALVEAQARVEVARASRPLRPIEPSTESSLASNTEFESKYCDVEVDVVYCKLDRNSGYWAQQSSTDAAACTVSVDAGQVRLRLLVEGAVDQSHDVGAGFVDTRRYDSGLFNDAVRCEVINVESTDRYDLSFRFNIN